MAYVKAKTQKKICNISYLLYIEVTITILIYSYYEKTRFY